MPLFIFLILDFIYLPLVKKRSSPEKSLVPQPKPYNGYICIIYQLGF